MISSSAAVEPLLLNMRQTTKALALSDRTIRELVKRGELKSIRQGRAVRFDPADLRAWIEYKKTATIDCL